MKKFSIPAAFIIFLAVLPLSRAAGEDYREVTPSSRPVFPRYYYYLKDYRVQWWYFTGHLYDSGGREFGYELTFFAVDVQNRPYKSRFGVNDIYISHFALSDVKDQKFYFSEDADAGAYRFAGADDRVLRVWVDNNILQGTSKEMQIKAQGRDMSLHLTLTPRKPLVLNGDHGYSRKSAESPLIASIYFSYTDLATEGLLEIGQRKFRVTGRSWFDREISSRGLPPEEVGWDWFAIQLDDDSQVMLYLIRRKDGSFSPYSSGTFVYANGSYRNLGPDDFRVSVLDHYRSKKTGANYPSRWRIAVPSEGRNLLIVPLIRDQEIVANTTGNHYWEGDCKVEGSSSGRAYVELTGY
jgi:predicted secreted hydrolase